MTTKRNAYHRPVAGNWWRETPFYRFYMLREGTALPALFFSIELIFGLYALKQGPESWAHLVSILQNPIMILLNIVALAAALLHTKTWFDLAPKASIIIIGDEKLGPGPLVKGLWAVMVLVSLTVIALAFLL